MEQPKGPRVCISIERLQELFSYDPETGILVWIKANSSTAPAGSIAGKKTNSKGYCFVRIDGVHYSLHRLAWFYTHGYWPDQVDHINGIRSDNRIANLRDVSSAINAQNRRKAHVCSRTGILGVIRTPSGSFHAEIRVRGLKKHLGTFPTAIEAQNAYLNAKREFHEGSTI